MAQRSILLAAVSVGLALGCGQSDAPGGGTAGAGGESGAQGGNSGGGGAAAGGTLVGRSGAGGKSNPSGTGGATNSGGAAGAVAASGGAGPGSGGDAGDADGDSGSGDSGGAAGAGGSGGRSTSPAMPSTGCAKMAGRPDGGKVTVDNDHIYDFPASYDGKTPMPLLIAMHGANNPYTELERETTGTRVETSFVRAFPKSAGSGWVYNTDAPRIARVYDDLLANYCIDTSRVFATGHSSGAQMVVQMLCAAGGETRFKAVAPVAASKYCNKLMPIAVMYIQGMMDAMRGNANGMDVVNVFTSGNTCRSESMPYVNVPSCTSTFDHMTVNPGCVTYQGCATPTIWCSHDDHGYNGTDGYEHGWPCFASNAMADFFLGLP